ncbi:GrpB family protein [Halopelagius fulvigenes]|uniref:GrpB family protein n=1 Tax=Halopelagius fulvigenes TaxID=1198324 RepID=A0ABD5TZ14_9EURY
MVGLERGTVELEPYDEGWARLYEEERERLKHVAGDRFLDFEHIGSTAIKGMPAKPIIDILAVVEDLDESRYLTPVLEECGFEYRPEEVEGRLFFAKGPRTNRTYYLSVTERGSDFYEEKIAFRDYLSQHPKAAERYASLKTRLAEKYPENRGQYTRKKGQFVQDVLDLAIDDSES